MYPSLKISTTALNDLLNNKVISTECLCCDYHLGLYTVEEIWPTALYCFLLASFYDWIHTFFKLGGENRGMFNYGAIWGWLCCALVVVLVFFLKRKCGGEKMGCFWLTDCEDEDQSSFLILTSTPLVSHFNIIAAADFKRLLFELTQNIFISIGKMFKDGQENTKQKCKTVTKWKLHDHMSCYVYRAGKDFGVGVLWPTHTPAFQNLMVQVPEKIQYR